MKTPIADDPDYQELVRILGGMAEDRRQLALRAISEFEQEEREQETWVTTGEAAKILSIAQVTVRYWVQHGKIASKKVGGRWRVSLGAINDILQGQSQCAHRRP